LDDPGQTRIVFRFPDEPFRGPRGGPGVVEMSLPLLPDAGVFTAADPVSPLTVSLVALADTGPLLGVHSARLELTEISQAPTIWIGDLHGMLDLKVGADFVRLRIEF
jgi:hypothetical protein